MNSKAFQRGSSNKKAVQKRYSRNRTVERREAKGNIPSKFYICIRQVGYKYITHPAPEHQYEKDRAEASHDTWYYKITKSTVDFAAAGVFGTSYTFDVAQAAILTVDPAASEVYTTVSE